MRSGIQPTSNEKQEKPLLDICAADLSEKTPPPDEARNWSDSRSEQLPGGTCIYTANTYWMMPVVMINLVIMQVRMMSSNH